MATTNDIKKKLVIGDLIWDCFIDDYVVYLGEREYSIDNFSKSWLTKNSSFFSYEDKVTHKFLNLSSMGVQHRTESYVKLAWYEFLYDL